MKIVLLLISKPKIHFQVHNGPPHFSNFGYSYAKRMIDVLNHGYNEQYGKMFTSVVPCNVFGPFDNFDIQSSHVVPALIRKMYDATEKGKFKIIYSTKYRVSKKKSSDLKKS